MKVEKKDGGFRVESENFSLFLYFEHDDLELWGTITPHRPGPVIDFTELVGILNNLLLKGHVVSDNVHLFCRQVGKGEKIEDMLLMRGQEPVNGQNGHLELLANAGQAADGTVNRLINVAAGQVIARSNPPTTGTAGTTLTWKAIPASNGEAARFKLGDGVKWGENSDPEHGTGEIVAMVDGRMIYEHGTLSVSDTIIIDGDVDQHYGNVDFIGSVEIRGEVKHGKRIKAGKDIRIKGNVESAFVEAEGNIEIAGGVSGKEKGMIKAGGNLSLRYIDICRIECRGNLTVKNEIVGSEIMAGGYIDVSNGSIIGGHSVALRGIDAKIFGSELGVPTTLVVGQCYLSERKIAELRQEEEFLSKRLEEISKTLDPYIKNSKQLNCMTAEERQELQQLSREFTQAGIRLKQIPDEITAIANDAAKRSNPMINVGRMMAKGVDIRLDNVSVLIDNPIRKSFSIIRKYSGEGVRYINRIKLTDNARKIEHDLAMAEKER